MNRTRSIVLAAVLGLVAVGAAIKIAVSREDVVCEACEGSAATACGAAGCEHGTVSCTGACLRVDMPGWQQRNVPSFPPALLWMKFTDADGAEIFVSQAHLGDVVESRSCRWTLAGRCPTCQGKTRVACPACQGMKPCPDCSGKGTLRKWF